jgi:hypothetical protein
MVRDEFERILKGSDRVLIELVLLSQPFPYMERGVVVAEKAL